MYYTDNPDADYDRWLDEQWEISEKIPDCVSCGLKIIEDHFWQINGDIYCEKCARKEFTKSIDDYLEEREEGQTF